MMKTSFKTFVPLALAAVVTANVVLPGLVFALSHPVNTQANAGFCAKLPDLVAKVDQQLADRRSKLEAKRTEVQKKIEDRKAGRQAKVQEAQTKTEAKFVELIAKLQGQANTESQSQAVGAFEAAVNSAKETRKAASAAAQQTYEQGIEQVRINRKSTLDLLISTFKISVQTALDRAKADCASNLDQKTIRETLSASVKAAKDKLKSDKQAIEKSGTLDSLRTARKQAVEQAQQDFKAAMEIAKADLKAAFANELSE